MKILIVSDSHGQTGNVFDAIRKEAPLDLLIHCGDHEKDEIAIREVCDWPVVMVRGNNDFFSKLNLEEELEIGKYQVLVTHGHRYAVNSDREELKEEARRRYFDLVFYGHTHRPEIDTGDDVMVVNPGSISLPRQEGQKKTYCVMEIDAENDPIFQIKYM